MLQITPRALRMIRDAQTRAEERLRAEAVVTREAKRQPRQLNRNRREHLIGAAVTILKRGVSSKFEFEASCRYGLRQSLCLQGWSWSDADAAAREIVAVALSQIGAERPTWYEGQPEWTQPAHSPIERIFCERCGTKIPDERGKGAGTAVRFCSDLCRNAARTDRSRSLRAMFGAAEAEIAIKAYHDRKNLAHADAHIRVCEGCGDTFKNGDGRSRYCSRTCANRANFKPIARKCECCGKSFIAKRRAARYCSGSCNNRAYKLRKAAASEPRACQNCGASFQSHKPDTRFCNLVCAAAANHQRLPDLTCAICRTGFRPRGPFDKRRYCSSRCQTVARHTNFQCSEVTT